MNLVNRTHHTTILGQTGFGKSAFLHNLIIDDIRNGTSAVVFDPHEDLIHDVLVAIPGQYIKNVAVLSVSETMPFGLNLYQCENTPVARDRAVDGIVQIFKKLLTDESAFYPRMEYVIRNTTRTILNSGYTMSEIPALFYNDNFRKACLSRVTNPAVHLFWQEYEARRSFERLALIESTMNKIDQFLSSEAVSLIFSQSKTTVSFSKILARPSTILLISLPIGILGRGVTEFLGMVLLSQLSQAIYERVNRFPIHVYIDEYPLFASSTTAQLYFESRKFGVSMISALQTLEAVDQENRAALLTAGNLVLFQVQGGYDAEILSKQLHIKQPLGEQIPRMRMVPHMTYKRREEWTNPEAEAIWKEYERRKPEIYARAEKLYNEIKITPFGEKRKRLEDEYSRIWEHGAEMAELNKYCQLISYQIPDGFVEDPNGKIYDMVEGTPRTFADLWHEMQVTLASLPPYNCYIQTINENKEIVETRQVTARPPKPQPYGQRQVEEIIRRSIAYFGRPAEVVRTEAEARIALFLKAEEKPQEKSSEKKPEQREKISRVKTLEG